MIVVDVNVEAMGKVYDFKLDENVSVAKLIDEMVELIARKEKCKTALNTEGLIFCKQSTGQILPHRATPADCGVVSGDTLMLI